MPKRLIDLQKGQPLLDIASYGRRGPGARWSPHELELITYTARRTPEVVVKVSGGATSRRGALAHLKYIDRRGQLEIETDQGETVQGKEAQNTLVDDWELDLLAAESRSPYRGIPGCKPAKLVHNIVLSMPAGTPPAKLLAASREFAREEFALKHRYAMVLHTDQDHPHVHLVVKAVSEDGKRRQRCEAGVGSSQRIFAPRASPRTRPSAPFADRYAHPFGMASIAPRFVGNPRTTRRAASGSWKRLGAVGLHLSRVQRNSRRRVAPWCRVGTPQLTGRSRRVSRTWRSRFGSSSAACRHPEPTTSACGMSWQRV
jgi:hypothetical protein